MTKCVNRSSPLFKKLKNWLGTTSRAEDAVIKYTRFRKGNLDEYIIPTLEEYSKYLEYWANTKYKDMVNYLSQTEQPTLEGFLAESKGVIHKWKPEFERSGRLVVSKGIEFLADSNKAFQTRLQQVNLQAVKKLEQQFPDLITVNKGLNEYYTVDIQFPATIKKTETGVKQVDYSEQLSIFDNDYPQFKWLNNDEKLSLIQEIDKGTIDSTCL